MGSNLAMGSKTAVVFTVALLFSILFAATALAAEPLSSRSFIVDATSNWGKVTPENKTLFFEDYSITLHFDTTESDYVAVTWHRKGVTPIAPVGMAPLGEAFFFTTGDQLSNYKTYLEMSYLFLLPLDGIIEDTLMLYYYDETAGQWIPCNLAGNDQGVNLDRKYIRVELSELGHLYGIFGKKLKTGTPAEPEKPKREPGLEELLPQTAGTIPLLLPVVAALFVLTGTLQLVRRRITRDR